MKAFEIQSQGSIEKNPLILVDRSIPSPGEREVLIKISVCGMCHTDLHTVEGDLTLPQKPVIPGHQAVGIIEEIGKNVKHLRKGDCVGTTWLFGTCGDCHYCKKGQENLCDHAQFTGFHTDGGYAEYVVMHEDFAVRMPDGFSHEQAAPLLCAGVIGYRSLRLCEVNPGENLGLYGFGAAAHITIQIARFRGCHVYVFTRSDEHKAHAIELGAVWAGNTTDKPPELMEGSILFAPSGKIVPEALKHLKKGGTVVINAVHMSNIPEMPYERIYYEKTLRSVANCSRSDAEELMKLATEIPIKTDIELFSFSMANEGLQKLKNSQIRGAAVLDLRR